MSRHRLAFPFSFLARPPPSPRVSPRFRNHGRSKRPTQAQILTSPPRAATFACSARLSAVEPASQRYGTANEPPPHLKKSPAAPPPANASGAAERQARIGPPPPSKQLQDSTAAEPTVETKADDAARASQPATGADAEQADVLGAREEQAQTTGPHQVPPMGADFPVEPGGQSALQTIMGMRPPAAEQAGGEEGEEKPPHLEPPRYVHHFDTYTLVRSLQAGGFSEEEAVTTMKAVRAVLADNMELARKGLMSKSDAEMAAYLFRAACSELRAEMQNRRSALTERMRTERTSLQHEVDIVSQQITAETGTLKDDLKGMFDDRKMAVRMERRDIENKTQELNYTITTRVQSEMRQEVEGLRWVLVRRTAMALAAVAVAALLTLRIAKVGERRKDAAAAEGGGVTLGFGAN